MGPVFFALAAWLPFAGAIPTVSYSVEESRTSWQPLDPEDIEKTIEHAALEVLSRPGLMQLAPRPKRSQEAGGDYVLEIRGRALDEAETHSVYLTFGPGRRTDLASFRASDTVVLQKQSRAAMLSAIEASARKAAADLVLVLKAQLLQASARAVDEPPPDPTQGKKETPWRWADVRIPQVSSLRAAQGLYASKPKERMAALRQLTSLALSETSPRNALEACALHHKDNEMRLGCLVALRPSSRRHPPTQRVVIEAFRKDASGPVLDEASEQMTYFTGLSLKEAAEAWLERAAKGEVRGPIAKLGDIPNLDPAIQSCLVSCGKREKYQRSKRACIELLKPVPPERRRRILMRHLMETNPESPYYLEGAGKNEGSTGTDWQWAIEAVLEDATTWDPKIEDILWGRYQRTLSETAIDILAEIAAPSERLSNELFEVVQTAGERRALWGLKRIAKEKPDLRPKIVEKLSELLATSAYPKTLSKHDLDDAIRELTKEDKPR